ncbi:MAG TPA: AsmA-like C-terminal region-containing protein [Candidatus Acidoferrales bacterium]|nr:AsmA-like C-terminal region-containing protein [Candidatus Acidoferrales bacterium]
MKIPLKGYLAAALLSVAVLATAVGIWAHRTHPLDAYVRRKAVNVMRKRFKSDLELASLNVSVLPRLRIEGTGLTLKYRGRTDVPPLMAVRKFALDLSWKGEFFLDANWLGLSKRPPHFHILRLEGLQINIPPREEAQHDKARVRTNFMIDEITSSNAELDILRTDDKPTLTFLLHQLNIVSFQPEKPAEFYATLTNPRPVGEIQTHGQFGPWNGDEPSQAPVQGNYTFSRADLATFKGISGFLSSQGVFSGVLDYIQVHGKTQTPDFALTTSNHPVPLNTEFNAIVDGINGNTILNSVDAQLLNSSLLCKGEVAKMPGDAGRTIVLDVTAQNARIEDLLRLVVKSEKPLMTGNVSLKTKFALPSRNADKEDITDRLLLNGRFGLGAVRFAKNTVQEKVNSLSRRGRGDTDPNDDDTAVSSLQGNFTLRNGVAKFSQLTFTVSGAKVLLHGTYDLNAENLDFRGTLNLQAKLSQTTTGVKSLFLKMIDPLFKSKDAGTVLPIKITGTREKPLFKLDMGRVFAKK